MRLALAVLLLVACGSQEPPLFVPAPDTGVDAPEVVDASEGGVLFDGGTGDHPAPEDRPDVPLGRDVVEVVTRDVFEATPDRPDAPACASMTVSNCCGVACAVPVGASSAACVAGRCGVGECNADFGDCDGDPANGCETRTSTAVDHCGACRAPCAEARACLRSACVARSCAYGRGECDEVTSTGFLCETNILNDPANCGGCGRRCATGEVCTSGFCEATCRRGEALCRGRCLRTTDDRFNCGGCEVVCHAPQRCADSRCVS